MLKPTKPQAKGNELVTLEMGLAPLIWSCQRPVGTAEEDTPSLPMSSRPGCTTPTFLSDTAWIRGWNLFLLLPAGVTLYPSLSCGKAPHPLFLLLPQSTLSSFSLQEHPTECRVRVITKVRKESPMVVSGFWPWKISEARKYLGTDSAGQCPGKRN